MKKILNFKHIASFLLIGVLIASCQDDDSTNISSSVKPVLTAEVTSVTVSEGEDAVLNFTLDKAINKPIQYRLVMLDESTAIDQDDYVIPGCRSNDPDCVAIEENGGPVGYIFEIPAYATEYSVNIQTILDAEAEGAENLRLKVISNRTLLGTVGDLVFDINIQNVASDDLSIRLNWDGTFESGGESVDFCDVDMDLELYDSSFDLIDFSYNDCPEALTLITPDTPDGTYYLDVSLWTTSGYTETINVPARINFFKAGSTFNETTDISTYFPMADGGLDDGNGDALITFEIVKTGNTYTITDPDGSTVFQGRMANSQAKKNAKKAFKKKK